MTREILPLLWPSLGELTALLAVFLVAAACVMLGGLALGRLGRSGDASQAIEVRLVAGWGVACIVLTFWGVASRASLAIPGYALLATAVGGLSLSWARPSRAELLAAGRLCLIALPLIVVMASTRPALLDTFLNLVPNAAYLVDHNAFPDRDDVVTMSIFPALPYHQQFIAFLAALVSGSLPASGLAHFNLILQMAMGLGLARLLAGDKAISWRLAALGLLLATGLNPGFMTKIALSSMGEPASETTLGLAAILGLSALALLAQGRRALPTSVALALVLVAHINIRQSNIGLFAGLMVGLGGIALLDPRLRPGGRALLALVAAALPAALIWLAWRGYVTTHFQAGELKVMPFEQWRPESILEILGDMARQALQRPYLYVMLLATLALLPANLARRGWSDGSRAVALLWAVTIVYNIILVFTYIAHFPGEFGIGAHSFYRYTTHYALVLVVALVLYGREDWRSWFTATRARWIGGLAIVGALAMPIVGLSKVRHDLSPVQRLVWDMSKGLAPGIGDGETVGVVAPSDNDGVGLSLKGFISLTPPRRLNLRFIDVADAKPETLDRLAAAGATKVIIACAAKAGLARATPTPDREALVLERAGESWRPRVTWTYPAGNAASRLEGANPLCQPSATP